MTILTVSQDPTILKKVPDMISKSASGSDLITCKDSLEALAVARKQEIHVAFLSIAMPELNGLDLGQYLKELNPFVNLIYMDDKKDKGADALQQHASGFLLNPIKKQDVQTELSDLRYPEERKDQKRVFAQTFGNFDFFIDGKPVVFKYNRTKEMVALMINNRGAQTSNGEIIATLWEDDGNPDKKGSYLRNLRQDLQNTLTRLKATNIILKQRGSMAIDVDRIQCDLYDWLEDPKKSRYRYLGEYMNQYSWGEYLHAELDEICYSMEDEF